MEYRLLRRNVFGTSDQARASEVVADEIAFGIDLRIDAMGYPHLVHGDGNVVSGSSDPNRSVIDLVVRPPNADVVTAREDE